MNHIHVIAPIANQQVVEALVSAYVEAAAPEFGISGSALTRGPESIESAFEDALAAPQVVERAIQAERAGADAVIVDCMNDPGVEAAREAVSIPVVGAAQASMLLAGMLAHQFTVIGTHWRDVRPTERLVNRYGLAVKYASTRWVDIPVLDLNTSMEKLIAGLVEQSAAAVLEDGAHAIIFGCTLMRSARTEVQNRLKTMGLDVPVIDPSMAALKWAEMLVSLGLSSSRRSYPLLPVAERASCPSLPLPAGQMVRGQAIHPCHLAVVVPVTAGGRSAAWLQPTQEGYCSAARRGTSVDVLPIEDGPSSLITPYYEALAVPEVLRVARRAEKAGVDAIVLDCMADPGLEALREALNVPVVGPMQASTSIAASLARRYSVIGTEGATLDLLSESATASGLAGKLASVRGIGLSPEEIENDRGLARQRMAEEARRAVMEDDAHAIIPGCTDMIGLAASVRQELLLAGLDVPVIEPAAAAIRMAEALCDLGLVQSKRSWPLPPHKYLHEYADLMF